MSSPGSRGRSFDTWDWLGAGALLSVGAMLSWAAARPYLHQGRSYATPMQAMLALGLAAFVGVGGGAVVLARRRHLSPGDVPRALLRVWLEPPRDWVMFFFGVLATVPMAAYVTRVILGDADSARILASVFFVQREGPGYFIRSQDNLLPHALFGPAVAMGSIALAKVVSVASIQVLAGVVSYISWRLFRTAAAALGSVLALLAFRVIPDRAGLLPMYPLMLALAYLGVFLAYRAIHSVGRRRLLRSLAAGLCLALAAEAHNIGLFFFLVPALLVFTTSFRQAAQGLWRVYLWLALFALPRAVINLADGGLSYFFLNRVDFWITKGYLNELQVQFYRLPVRLSMGEYLSRLPDQVPRITGATGLVPLVLAAVTLPLRAGRLRWFAIACLAYFITPIIVTRGPFFPRYYSPVLVGAAIAVGAALPLLLGRFREGRKLAALYLTVLAVVAGISFVSVLDKTRGREAAILGGPYRALAARVDDGKGVIGSRSVSMLFTTPRIATFGGQFLTEQELVTYLTWPSDWQVVRMMRARNIGWVLIGPRLNLETTYHDVWLVPHHGSGARQVYAVARSPAFCLALKRGSFSLYRLGRCAAP
jgi:hypothetical protein